MKSLKEISRNIASLSEGMFDLEGGDRLEKGIAKDSTKMFLDTCKGSFNAVYYKDGGCRVNGKLIISGVESEQLYVNIKDFHGKLIIENCPKLTTLQDSFLSKMAVFDGSVTINACPSLTSVIGLPGLIKGDLSITNCKKLKSIDGIDTVFGNVYWQGNGKKYTEEQLKDVVHVIKKIFCGETEIEANVEEGLVVEAFNNPWLQRLAAQFKKYPYKEYSWRDNEPDRYNKVNDVFSKYSRLSRMYGRVLDKITSDDVDAYDMSNEKDKKDLAKAFWDAYSAKNNNGADLFLVYKEDIGEFIGGFGYVWRPRGSQNEGVQWIYFPTKDSGPRKMGEGNNYTKTEAKQKLLDYGNGYTVVVINSGSKTGTDWKSINTIKSQRQEAQRGVINPGDVEQYKEIAAANLKRYKDAVAQIKLDRKKKDEASGYDKVIDEYEQIQMRIIKFVRGITKDPKQFHKYEVEGFLNWCRDERRRNPNYRWGSKTQSEYYGENGLVYYFNRFMDNYLTCFGDSYKSSVDTSDYTYLETATANLRNAISIADQKLKKFGY